MSASAQPSAGAPRTGILLALGGAVVLSMNDLAIKALADTGYALHQVILIRALIGMALVPSRHIATAQVNIRQV